MTLPSRYSLLWRLTGTLALFCLLLVSLHVDLGRLLMRATSYLPETTKTILTGYAKEAEADWQAEGPQGVDGFLLRLRAREQIWAVVVDGQQRSLSSRPLEDAERQRLRFVRQLDGQMGRPDGTPTFEVPFSDGESRLVMTLPERLSPRKYRELWEMLLQRVLPTLLAVLLGILLYRLLIAPLATLRHQAVALSAGDLAGAFNHMAGRLEDTLTFQRQLLRDLSHELRTPLSRLRVAGEQAEDVQALSQRLEREVEVMERLIADSLELVWLDTERPSLPLEPVDVGRLWDVLRENASFESGWSTQQLPCELPADCSVLGNLNGLAQAMENILRNAIRHSPADGVVRLAGHRDGNCWHLWIEDQGPGVEAGELERIFQPFARLNAARPGGDGFGLGLAIARSTLRLQGGALWAENRAPGLRLTLRLQSV